MLLWNPTHLIYVHYAFILTTQNGQDSSQSTVPNWYTGADRKQMTSDLSDALTASSVNANSSTCIIQVAPLFVLRRRCQEFKMFV